jgi:hypothetical protein
MTAHLMVAFLQTFFGGKKFTNLLALKKQLFILVFAAVFFELSLYACTRSRTLSD